MKLDKGALISINTQVYFIIFFTFPLAELFWVVSGISG